MVAGINNVDSVSVYGGNTVTFTSGIALDATKDDNVAMIGAALAEKNNLSAGSTFTAYDETITVSGVYDTGNTFSNNGVIMSLLSLQRLSGQTGSVTSATVTVDSVDNIDSTVTAIQTELGDSADVVSNQDNTDQIIAPLESVKTIATYSVIGSMLAGAVIILLTMVMIVRERRREIGVLKAIGAPNRTVMGQFITEAVTLTVMGMLVGLVIGVAAANPLTQTLVTNSSSSASQQVATGPGQGMGRMFPVRGIGGSAIANARDVQASVGWEMLGYGVLVALLIAIIGSAFPAYIISKVRPAEVMRAE
jgi:putative ABC transport system permease protein